MKRFIFASLLFFSTLFAVAMSSVNASMYQSSSDNSAVKAATTTHNSITHSITPDELSLIRTPQLDTIAQKRATDMKENGYYAHKSPAGSYFYDYFEGHGIDKDTASCENLLLQKSGLTRNEVNNHWNESESHNACLKARHTAYGYAEIPFDSELQLSVYVYIAASL